MTRSPRRGRGTIRAILALSAAVVVAGCDTTEPTVEPSDPAGVWQAAEPDVSEVTLELAANGSFERISADLAARTCVRSAGRWSASDGTLVLEVTEEDGASATRREELGYRLVAGGLELSGDGATTTFAAVGEMPSCVDYGWGEWTGRLEAEVDGVVRAFGNLEVALDVAGGSMVVRAYPCPDCPRDEPELVLEIDAGTEALEPATYPVDNVPDAVRTFFALYHPDPGNPDFQGFTTERLSPPGEFVLSGVADDRILGTFFFQGNPRVEGETGPDGSTSVQVTEGVVDLTYR